MFNGKALEIFSLIPQSSKMGHSLFIIVLLILGNAKPKKKREKYEAGIINTHQRPSYFSTLPTSPQHRNGVKWLIIINGKWGEGMFVNRFQFWISKHLTGPASLFPYYGLALL